MSDTPFVNQGCRVRIATFKGAPYYDGSAKVAICRIGTKQVLADFLSRNQSFNSRRANHI